MITIHKLKHIGSFKKCCNCDTPITFGHIIEVNTNQFILCKVCRHKLTLLSNINDNYDHMLTSDQKVY